MSYQTLIVFAQNGLAFKHELLDYHPVPDPLVPGLKYTLRSIINYLGQKGWRYAGIMETPDSVFLVSAAPNQNLPITTYIFQKEIDTQSQEKDTSVPTCKVGKIVKQNNRILLYPEGETFFHLIADADTVVEIGDTIEYEPYGYNFGWFIRVVE